MSSFPPTPEQQAIITAASTTSENIMVEADAGCTKTTTLKMLAAALRAQPVIALAFNKKIAVELEGAMPSFVTVKTFNGLGHGAFAKAVPGRLTLVDRKIGKIVSQLFKEEKFEAAEEDWILVRDWTEAARKAGIVHSSFEGRFRGLLPDTEKNWMDLSTEAEPSETLYEFAREALKRSIAQALNGEIDFDDQIYASVLLGGVYPKFPLVIVDEAQDLSPLNHEQIKRLGPQARLIVVGDPKQAIYSFRGADSASMGKLKALRPKWLELGLHTTFRCPKVMVERNRGHAPFFRAAETNAEGEAHYWLPAGDLAKIAWKGEMHDKWGVGWLRSLKATPSDRIFILCRNNAPLLGLAFKLIRQGVGPNMMGRDIGAGLIRLAKKISDGKPGQSLEDFVAAVGEWRSNEREKARLMEKDHLIAGIEDRAECLLAVVENPGVRSAGDVCKALEALFAREHGELTLATGHRAKGLESEIVLHLDPWRIPSKYALSCASQMQQEKNLNYVIETRTRRVFVEASLGDFV